jgi:hypothetical protein
LHVSEQKSEQTSGESGCLNAGPAVATSSDAQSLPASTHEISEAGSPDMVPGQGAAPEVEPPKAEPTKAEAPKPEIPKREAAGADAPRLPGKVMIMSSGGRAWESDGAGPELESEPESPMFGKRRLSALAAVVALATIAGALGGALATAGLTNFLAGGNPASAGNGALEASVARIDADLLALKASVEHTSKISMAQFNKASDRLDKVEKAQAEPAARLARLSEAVDKLRAAPQVAPAAVAAAPAAAKDVTGSIAPPAAAPKVEVARLPTVEGWVLRDVANGGALIEGRQGMYEVYAGDPVPGLGRVDAIRRQDGRWVVVTTRGLVVAR